MCEICMGMKIKAKFDGSCKNCGETWVVDDEINYQKSPKEKDAQRNSVQNDVLASSPSFF